ncbi:MAG TPA: DUF1499 domain-containing protein [Vicinamibacteria bacterium]|nr:DUF1499 domain-containing protein [Vicinamibacteria bacterium]
MSGRRLPPCPDKPNCVSTQASDPTKRMPALGFDGEPELVRAAILDVLTKTRGARVVKAESDYIHAEFTTLVFRFVDDVEFAIDPVERRVDFRSASRVGHSDLGANRRRMESLCRRLEGLAGLVLLRGNG